MASLNRCDLIGNLGRDPEIRYMPDGGAVCTLSVATTEKWNDKAGVKKERTEWHRIVCYNKLAELAAEYLQSGSEVFFSGALRTRSYDDKDGVTRYSTEIVAKQMIFLGKTRKPATQTAHNGEDGARDELGGDDTPPTPAPRNTRNRRPAGR